MHTYLPALIKINSNNNNTGHGTEWRSFSDRAQGLNFKKDAVMFYFPPGQHTHFSQR